MWVCASFVVAEKIAKYNHCTWLSFHTLYMLAVLEEICPEKKKQFEDMSLSTRGPVLDKPKS